MLAELFKPEPMAIVQLSNGEEVRIGFVRKGLTNRMGFIFAVERALGVWVALDVRKVGQLGDLFAGVCRADSSRLRAVGDALSQAFSTREDLAWALADVAVEFSSSQATAD